MKAKKLKPSESMRAAYLSNMVKISSQDSPLMSSIQLNDDGAGRADDCSLNFNQAGGAAKIPSSTVDCDKSTSSTVREDGNADLWMGGKEANNSNSNLPHTDPWNTSLICVRKEDENTKWNASGWPRWATTSEKSKEGNSTMACKRGWNDSEDVKAKRKASEGGDGAFYLDGVDGCKQSNMVDKGNLSNSCWEKKDDGNRNKEIDGWSRCGGSISKTIKDSPRGQNKNTGWNRSQKDDGDGNKEIDGWPSWGGSISKTIKDSPRGQNKNTGWNRSLDWTGSDLGDFQKEDGARNSDPDPSKDPWMQHSTVIPSKCDWNKSAGWASSKGYGLDRNNWKQSIGLDQTGSDPWKHHCPNKRSKDCRKNSRSWAAPEKSCVKKKHEWSRAPRFCNLDASGQHGSRLGSGSDQSTRDHWMQLDPSSLPRFGGRKSSSLKLNKGKGSFRDEVNWSITPNCGDPDASNKQERHTYKQKGHTFLPKVGGERPFSSRSKIMSWAPEHESYQSNDRCRVEADIYANYRDSPLGTSKRGYGAGDAHCRYSDRNMDGFEESNKPQCLIYDRWKSSENPWQQGGHLQKTHSSRHESYGNGAGKSNFSRMDTSYDGCNNENADQVSTWNHMKIHNSTARDELRQSHMMIGGCFKPMTDHDAQNSHHVWKTQQNYYISQQAPQTTLSPFDVQNDGFAESAIQFDQNVQVNSQLPPSPKSSNPKGQSQDHDQPAMSNGNPVKENDDTSRQHLKFLPLTAVSSSDPVRAASVPDNEGSSSTNFPSRNRFSPVSMKASKTSEELNVCTNELTTSERNLNTSICSVKKLQSGSCDPCHHEPFDDKGIRMFKFALAEFVKKILQPTWKEGGLSLEAHRTVVKKVVDKVIRVLGTNVPRTQAMIDRYMSFANDKLNKLTQDYLEIFINT